MNAAERMTESEEIAGGDPLGVRSLGAMHSGTCRHCRHGYGSFLGQYSSTEGVIAPLYYIYYHQH